MCKDIHTGRNFDDFFITANALPRHPDRCHKQPQESVSSGELKKNKHRQQRTKNKLT